MGRDNSITYPVAGNHEYLTADASGYYAYFDSRAGDPELGYYSYTLGEWHMVALNSNCSKVGGCDLDSPQGQWLEADLAAHPNTSSWLTGIILALVRVIMAMTRAIRFWEMLYTAGADLVLVGHDHNYERFALQDPEGLADPERGIRQFVVGTGGKGLRPLEVFQPNSEIRNSDTYGVLKLRLYSESYDWEFLPEFGAAFTDKGEQGCHE